jgi:HK97 family phage portal protein
VNFFGFTVARTKAAVQPMSAAGSSRSLMPVRASGGFFSTILESFPGAWQKNVTVDSDRNLLAFSAVYACVTLIANDIGKLRLKLTQETTANVWKEVDTLSPYWPVMRKPNRYQNRIQFFTQWVVSKLLYGNAYVLKQRDARGIVTDMYVLDPRLVFPLVAPDGSVFYQLNIDLLSEILNSATVPASEIIHDRMPTLWHPLMGVSPIYACGSSATHGIRIQANSAAFFENMSRPSGMLSAPGEISNDVAERLKKAFEENFSGSKIGRLAVLGDGLKYEAMTIPAADAQLIEQLRWTVEDVARTFHVPLHMIGAGNPTFQNIGSLTQSYYSQTLQTLLESMELALDEGLGLPDRYAAEFDLDALLRMDTTARYDAYAKGLGSGWMSPNEARVRENYEPVAGGDTPYLQQQNWSLAQLDKRDINAAPAAGGAGPPNKPITPTIETPAPAAGSDVTVPSPDAATSAASLAIALISKFAEAEHADS